LITINYDEVSIESDAFILGVIKNSNNFFTKDKSDFNDNFKEIIEYIFEKYNLPKSTDEIYDDFSHVFGDITDYKLNEIYDKIEDYLIEITDELKDDSNIESEAKSALKIRNILKGLNQDPDDNVIENELARIEINKDDITHDGKVMITLTDKNTNKTTSGYVEITNIPTHFKNYKLFEELKRIKNLIISI